MKRKFFNALLVTAMVSSMLVGCGSNNAAQQTSEDTSGEAVAAEGEEGSEEAVAEAEYTVGPEDAPHLDMWVFVPAHAEFYSTMAEEWNKQHADQPINITITSYPYGDMHNKLTLANQSGQGAPDLCDIEIGQFPNYLQGEVPFIELNQYIDEYRDDIVPARIDTYSKDGRNYGVPTHVGATVMYYNTKILEEYGIDYKEIKTWDDFTEAGKKLKEASNGEVCMTSVDTGGTDWLWVGMSEYGEDYTNEDGSPNINIPSVEKMITMQQGWLNDGIAMVSPGGQVDLEEGYANISSGKIVAFPKALWFMSRFINYIPEMEGQWAIAPCPVFEEGQPRSVGIGGTGTVVSNQSENAELAAKFLTWAKLSYEGSVKIWEVLGFDTCNTSLWTDPAITENKDNKYLKYFVTNPFDTLNEIKDEIGLIKVGRINPTISEVFNLTILNACLEEGADVKGQLEEGQSNCELEW